MNRALILGCSHAAGSEITKDPTIISSTIDDVETFERFRSYPAKIAASLGYMVDNKAIPGGSNDAVFRLYEASKLNPGDIVIACWTGINRTELYHEKQWWPVAPGYQGATVHHEFQKLWLTYNSDVEVGRQNKIKNVLALNSLAEMRGIKVINIDSFWTTERMRWPKNINWATFQTFVEYCEDRNFPKTSSGHYFLNAHQSFADFILSNFSHLTLESDK
jgi:hypothetical protein